jgi:aconitase B
MWATLPTFRRYILPPSSGSKHVRLVTVCIGLCFEKMGGLVAIGAVFGASCLLIGSCVYVHVDPDDGDSMYLRNVVGDTAHIHSVYQFKNGVNINS